MIHVDGLSRQYGDFIAVDDVSFEINQGEIVGLLGHNGAGKTTIMKMLTGFLEPDQGSISINNLDVVERSQAVKALIGYLPENLPLYPEMLVTDYLDFAAGLRGLEGVQKTQAIKQAIDDTDLSAKAMQPISTLSRGYRQRVGVAQAILHKPKLLILDEPTNGLDPTQTLHMRRLIQRYAEHSTVILSTHIMQEVDAICDRVLILRNGRLLIDESLAVLGHSHALLLDSDMNGESLEALLSGIADIDHVKQRKDHGDVFINLNKDVNIRQAAAKITRSVVEAGANVFSVQACKRDLETVFRDVNAGERIDVV